MSSKDRVLIIAIDGFTWKLARAFLDEGVMPNLAKMVQQGSHGNLRSVIPYETSPAWSAFQTGCFPGKTKIFAFHTYDRKSKKVRLNSFADIAVPSIWELADKADKTVVSLNMPVTSPAPKVKGVIIPGLLCPKLSAETVHPSEAYDKYLKARKNYMIVNLDWRDTVPQYAEQAIETESLRADVALELMNDVDWDLFCVQLHSSDTIQHKIWWALDRESEGFSEECRNQALEFYKCCDEIIGKLTAAAGDEALKFVVSDHGFSLKKAGFGLNTWLHRNGYLKYGSKKPEEGFAATKEKLKDNIPGLKALAKMYGQVGKSISGNIRKIKQSMAKPGSTDMYAKTLLTHMRTYVDFENTKAFSLGGMAGMIYINGTEEERKQLASELTDKLLAEFGPDSEKAVITSVAPASETYGVPEVSDFGPDLVVNLADGYTMTIGYCKDILSPGFYGGKQQGTHDRNGVFVANGPGVKEGVEFDADIVDIAPTALAFLSVAVPSHMDGKILNQAFSSPLSASYVETDYSDSTSADYSDDEQAQVEKNLRDLGYI